MRKPRKAISPKSKKAGIRIIGGQWRGRRLSVPEQPGLRPTLDRYRETLFNWLMFNVEGANCLDLFAGSGALGLESLSRGAKTVDFVDSSALAIKTINQHLQTLECAQAQTHNMSAETWLKQRLDNTPYDLVFLDPPFHQDLLQPCIYLLEYRGLLRNGSKIYLEAENTFNTRQLPPNWHPLKQKSDNNKIFLLLEFHSQNTVPVKTST